jgi:hypothetical protein
MIPKKPAPDVIRGGRGFREKIMLKRQAKKQKSAPQPTTPMLVSGGYCQHTEGFGEMA